MTLPNEVPPLEYTGERMVPELTHPETFWEHVFRYQFALRFAPGRHALDVACGEGYGTAALAASGAASVVGVDIDPVACAHARAKYGVDARVGSAEELPLADASVDLVVSFETIEHLREPHRMLRECRRVLRPGGRLVMSTPNQEVYGQTVNNPFHFHEMTVEEFCQALGESFSLERLYAQRPTKFCRAKPSTYFLGTGFSGRWARRVGNRTRRFFTPLYSYEPADGLRTDPVRLIRGAVRPGASFVNPYTVRRTTRAAPEKPCYVIAVARAR